MRRGRINWAAIGHNINARSLPVFDGVNGVQPEISSSVY